MTQYSRSTIPGRTRSAGDLDHRMFGAGADADEHPTMAGEVKVRARGEPRVDDAAYSRLPGDRGDFEVDDGGRARGRILLVGALAVVAVFGALVWNAYRQGLREPGENAAPALAAAGPFKSAPVELEAQPVARGAAIEAEVFERLERTAASEPVLDGGGETPLQTPPPRPENVDAYVAAETPPLRTTPAVNAEPAKAPVVALPTTGDAVKPTPSGPVSLTPKSAAPETVETARTVVVAAPTTPTRPSPRAASEPGRFAPDGPYVVQLGAPASEAAAEAEWTRKAALAGALMEGAEKLITRAEVNGRTVYRVRAGSFASAAEADAFCAELKGKGADCFRATR